MKDLRTYIKSLLIIVAIYSLIINLTILLTIILGDISNAAKVTENDTAPDRIYIEDLPELEITEEYDFAQEGIRI